MIYREKIIYREKKTRDKTIAQSSSRVIKIPTRLCLRRRQVRCLGETSLKYSSLSGGYGEENFVYLSSYVLASRSSDVSSQFGRLQSDQL